MAFRGFGDDALKVKADKREAALKAAQIAASERASMRSANVQMAGLQENARQANMANERAGAQLAQGENARIDSMNLRREQLADDIVSGQEKRALDEGARRDMMAATEAARKDDLSVKIGEMSQKERQLQLNESTAAKLDAEWQRQQAAQEEMQSEDTALQLAILRFAVNTPDGQVPMGFLNALNNHRGVAYGDPGSVTQVFGITDPTTKARVGTGMIKIGDDGKPIESILDPMLIIPKLLASMPTDKAMETIRNLTFGNQARGSDRVTAAAMKYARENRLEFAKSDPASLVKALAEQEDILRVTKPAKTGTGTAADPANQENLERVGRIKTNVFKALEAQTGGGEEEAAPAPTLSPEQKKFMELPGAAAGTGEEIDKRALVEQARREAKGDKAKAFELYNAALAKARGGNQEKASAPVVKKEATEAAALSNKEETSSLTYGPRIKEEAAKPTKFGPEEGTEGYLRDMPKGKAAEPTAKDVSSSRKEILARLEKAYRLPKSPDKEEKVRKIKAELDAFNKVHNP